MGGGYKSPVELNFSYKVAQVNFVITNNSSRTGTLSPYPYITGVPTDGKLRGNTWYDLTTGQANVRYNTSSSPAFPEEGNSKVIGPFYMIPCQLTSSSKFMLSCTEGSDTETFEVDLGGITWEAGKAYTYNIVISPEDYSLQYLTFKALESGTFSFSKAGLSYSLDNGATWTALAAGASTPTITAGNTVMWKNNTTLTPDSWTGIGHFSSTGRFEPKGNIMSLHYGDNFSGQTSLSGKNYAFYGLFDGSDKLYNAKKLVLPATTLASNCYYEMFRVCTNLTTAPELPATRLVNACYNRMFYGCTSLTKAPKLPATTLATYCYNQMFSGCTSLTTAPELPAKNLVSNCYENMFYNCKNLRQVKAAFTTTPSTSYTRNWLSGVSSTGTFYKNSAATWNVTGTEGVPSGWTVVRYTP